MSHPLFPLQDIHTSLPCPTLRKTQDASGDEEGCVFSPRSPESPPMSPDKLAVVGNDGDIGNKVGGDSHSTSPAVIGSPVTTDKAHANKPVGDGCPRISTGQTRFESASFKQDVSISDTVEPSCQYPIKFKLGIKINKSNR